MRDTLIFTFTPRGDPLSYCTYDHLLEMTRRFLMNNESFFQNLDVFEEDYVPETLQYRDAEADTLEEALRPALRGASPRNVVIRGISGTGKSTTVNSLFSELNTASNGVIAVNVNCKIERTTFGVFARIFSDLFGYEPSLTGTSTLQAVEKIAGWLHEEKKVLVVCLDDANVLNPQNHLIATLSYLLGMHDFCPGVRVGVVLTLSDMDFHLAEQLDSSVMSSLHPTEILYVPYNEETMYQILSERARLGFYSGVIGVDAVRKVAQISYEMSDLRIGIDLLKQSAYEAERNGRKKIVCEDIHAGYQESLVNFLKSVAKNLADKDCCLFWWTAEMQGELKGVLMSGTLYDAFCTEVKEGYTSFYHRLKRLETLRLINLIPRHTKGNTSEIMLRFDPKDVLAACESIRKEAKAKAKTETETVTVTVSEDVAEPVTKVQTKPKAKNKAKPMAVTATKAVAKAARPQPGSVPVSEDVAEPVTKVQTKPKAKPKGVTATKTVATAASPQPGSVPVSAASGDAGGVMQKQPEPMSFSIAERKESEGFGRNRSQGGTVT